MKYQSFIFKDYNFDAPTGVATFCYGYDDALQFTETFTFDFAFANHDSAALDRALQLLFFMAGVSYYKLYDCERIAVKQGSIDTVLANFLGKTYQKGLGEFYYVNKLDPRLPVQFPVTVGTLEPLQTGLQDGLLVGLGGGKDSLVSVELLRAEPKVATWSLSHRSQLQPLVEAVGLPHFWVARVWDDQLRSLQAQGARAGHVPISAIFSCVGAVVGILTGFKDAIVSNESSANEATLTYMDTEINHQYSKTLEYERDFQACLSALFGDSLGYYSLLRSFSELRIAGLFASLGFDKYKEVFSSCNRAYAHNQTTMFWCGECSKCAFVFLILTPFVKRAQLEQLWKGKNLLLEPSLEPVYRQLLGIEGDKPLNCVGEIAESRTAMRMAQDLYPGLREKYIFELTDYNYKAMAINSLNSELSGLVSSGLSGADHVFE